MATSLHMLADGDPTAKIVIGVVVALFWLASQIFGAVTKKTDKRVPPSGQRPSRVPPTVRPDGVVMPRQKPQPVPAAARTNRQKPPPPLRAPVNRPAAVPMQTRLPASPRQQPSTTAAAVVTKARAMPRAEMIRALLKTRNLQRAYVLTEILQPPVSMRADRPPL